MATPATAMDEKTIVSALQTSCTSDPRDLNTCIDTAARMAQALSGLMQKAVGEQVKSSNTRLVMMVPISIACDQHLKAHADKKGNTAEYYRGLAARTNDCQREIKALTERNGVSSAPFPQARKALDATLGWSLHHVQFR